VWVAGLAVAGTASIAAEPSMPGLPPLPPDPSTTISQPSSTTNGDNRVSLAQFPPLPDQPTTGLRPLTDPTYPEIEAMPIGGIGQMFQRPAMEPPAGFSLKSGIQQTEPQVSPDFVPIEDRWRLGYPEWDRYGKGHPLLDDYPYVPGRSINPFRQNV